MLPFRQNLLVALPEVAVKRSFTVALRDTLPQQTAGPLTPITDGVSHHLAGAPTQCQPDPPLVLAL
jgi:hypothetical protein